MVPTPEQWRTKLGRCIDQTGALSDRGIREGLVRALMNNWSRPLELLSSQLQEEASSAADVPVSQLGLLDPIFLPLHTDESKRLERVLFDLNSAVADELGPGRFLTNDAFRPLLEKLIGYVREHPFPEPDWRS